MVALGVACSSPSGAPADAASTLPDAASPDATPPTVGPLVRVSESESGCESLGSSMAWTGAEHGIAWMDVCAGSGEVFFARLDRQGNKLGTDLSITTTGGSPSVVWTGTEYAIAWHDLRDGTGFAI